MDPKVTAQQTLDGISEEIVGLSHQIHAQPELAFQEHRACEWVTEQLTRSGFSVETGVAGLPTALVATAGSGDLVLGVCAEYDALPDVGHACGHNIIAASAVAAGRALAPLVDELGITVKVFGTPAEERGGGKILMMREGVFDGVHATMMIHPAPIEQAMPTTLAVSHLEISYAGRTAHASSAPEKGLNAGDALTVAQVGIGLLRQHLDESSQVHGIITHGGEAPNIVPGSTKARYLVRSSSLAELEKLQPRVEDCFKAGALASGTEVTVEPEYDTYSEFEHDTAMAALYQANAESLGREFPQLDEPLRIGSTDMANVSLTRPTIHPMVGIDCGDAVNHQPEFTAWCATPSADKATVDGGLAMAWTGIDIALDPQQRARLLG